MADQAFKDELRSLCTIIDELNVFKLGFTENVREKFNVKTGKNRRVKPLDGSLRFHDGAVYCVAHVDNSEKIICIVRDTAKIPVVFKEAVVAGFNGYVVSMVDFNAGNLRRLLAEKPKLGPRSLKTYPRLGLGVRMLFTLPHLLEALKKLDLLADFQLSAGREFSLKEVVNAEPGVYPEWLGHTGLDAEALYNGIALECFRRGVDAYGTEIDHLIVARQHSRALARILTHGRRFAEEGSEGLESSMRYNYGIIDEAAATGFVKGITVDTSDLIRYEFTDPCKWPSKDVEREFMREFGGEAEEVLRTVRTGYLNKLEADIFLTDEEVMRIALKYRLCLLKAKELYEYFRTKTYGDFTYELSLDETPELTNPKELFFCLSECVRMGMPVDLVAPNVGFSKREDYKGSLDDLMKRVEALSAVAEHFNAILDFHSGSDKRAEVYRAISKACKGRFKLKVSTIYQLKYFETLAEFPKGSEERRVFEEIWDYTLEYVKRRALEGDEVAENKLREVVKRMGEPGFVKSPRDDFFRYYSFIVLNAKRADGRRIFKDRLYRLASRKEVYERYRRKVLEVTRTLAETLGLRGSRSRFLASESGG